MLRQAPVVAVTGATGYLGSQICETLEAGGWQVIRLVRAPERKLLRFFPIKRGNELLNQRGQLLRIRFVLRQLRQLTPVSGGNNAVVS